MHLENTLSEIQPEFSLREKKVLLKLVHYSQTMAHTFNLSTWEGEAGRSLSSRRAWSTNRAPGLPRLLNRETLSQKTIKTKKKNSYTVTLMNSRML